MSSLTCFTMAKTGLPDSFCEPVGGAGLGQKHLSSWDSVSKSSPRLLFALNFVSRDVSDLSY